MRSLESLNGMPVRDTSMSSSVHTIESEEVAAPLSASSLHPPFAQSSKQPRARHVPSVSWSYLGPVDSPAAPALKVTSATSPKPLQILPTHLSIPTIDFGSEHVMSTQGAVPSSAASIRQGCTSVDIASIELPSAAMADATATQGQLEEQPGASINGEEWSKDSVIVHQDSVIVHQDSLLPNESVGEAIAEGEEKRGKSTSTSERPSGVSFSPETKRNLHRHKSSNYSRLLDFRLDDWCAPAKVGLPILEAEYFPLTARLVI